MFNDHKRAAGIHDMLTLPSGWSEYLQMLISHTSSSTAASQLTLASKKKHAALCEPTLQPTTAHPR